ncbi:MAG: hypothetical protein DRO15_01515, partial [Thermoprotei archaeon]
MKSTKLWRRKGIEAPPLRRFKLVRASLSPFIDLIKKGELLETYDIGDARVYIYEFEGMGYYIIEEPELDDEEEKLYEILMDSLYFTVKPIEIENPIEYIKSHIFETSKKLGIKELVEKSFDKLMYYIVRDVIGYGPLDVLIKDPRIEDISLEGVGKPIRVFHRDYSYLDWLLTNLAFDEEEYLDGLITMVAHKSKKHVSTAFPVAEGALPEKHRVSITFSREVTPFGSSMTIRKFREEPLTITHLIKFGTISSLMAAYWWILLENKGSIFIVGEMASGKSVHPKSTLIVLMNNIPRVLTIEELWNILRSKAPMIKEGDIEYIELSNIDIKVLSINKSEITWARPKYIIRHKSPEKLVKIKLSSGREIIVTQDHSLLVMNSDNVLRIARPLNIKSDDYLVGISSIDIPRPNETTVMRLLIELPSKQGLSLNIKNSKGKFKDPQIIDKFTNLDEIYVADKYSDKQIPLSSLLRPEFGYLLGISMIHNHNDGEFISIELRDQRVKQRLEYSLNKLGFKYNNHNAKNSMRVNLDNTVSKILKALLIANSSDKKLPDIAWIMSKEWLASFILGVIDGSGYIDRNVIRLELSNSRSVHELLYIFAIFNIYPTIEVKRNNSNEIYILSLPLQCIEKLSNYVSGVLNFEIPKSLKENNTVDPGSMNSKIILEKVVSIEIINSDVDYVYDIEVPNLENFEVNTILVHNTTLLNALASMLPPSWKIVTIEDTPELRLPHIGWKPLVARHVYSLAEAKTEIGLFDLVKLSLRERAQFIIVGEIRGEEAYVFVQALASVTGDTPILIRDRNRGVITLISIGKLVDNFYKPSEDRVPKSVQGLEVLTLNTEGNVIWAPIRYVLRHRANEIYRIGYRGGELKATASHSVFVLDENTLEIKTKPVCELKPNEILISFISRRNNQKSLVKINLIELLQNVDNVEIVMRSGERTKITKRMSSKLLNRELEQARICINDLCLPAFLNIDEELALVLGSYLARGYVEPGIDGKICFTFNSSENSVARRVVKVMENRFSIKPRANGKGNHNIYEFRHPLLAMVFEKLMKGNSEEKHIPEFLWNSTINIVKAFLQGCKVGESKDRGYAIYVTKSKELAEELLWLARFYGMYSYITKQGGKRDTNYIVHILLKPRSKGVYPHELIPVSIMRNALRNLGVKHLPVKYKYALEKNKYITKKRARKILYWIMKNELRNYMNEEQSILNRLRTVLSDEIILIPIKEVSKEPYNGYVYDVSVPSSEAFFGGETPILLHNTGHGGGCTFHGDSIESMVMRLTTPPINVPISFLPLISNVVITRFIRIPGKR